MSTYKDFSSLPPDKETHFVVFEQTSVQALKKARIAALVVSLLFFVSVMVVVYSQPEPENLMENDDLGLLKKAPEEAEATPAATPPATPPADDSAEAGDGDGDGDEAAADEGDAEEAGDGDPSDGDE
ncbi:MAG: hypothetical protein Tsb0020_25210 [Haliangiales bacterium]